VKGTRVSAFAPATVSNVACGFDVLGFALHEPGDIVTAALSPGSGATIAEICGDDGRLPREASRNTASVAAQALLDAVGDRRGVTLTIRKGLPLSSGLGGSAASAVAAVVAVNALVGARASLETVMACAFEGERIGAGSAHGDNIAPAVYGGFVLVRVPNPPDVVRLPVPAGLTAVVVHPDLEIETAKARALLGTHVPLGDAIRQWANLGAFVDALHRSDFDLLSRSLEDTIGPSLFALCRSTADAERVARAMTAAVLTHIGGAPPQTYVSPIAPQGAHIVTSDACGS
jgi:homoserine kinase